MAIDVAGLCGILVFYVLILVIGIVAAHVKGRKQKNNVSATETVITAGRDIGYIVGTFTMTATWVGGGYINGTSEYVFAEGFGMIWTQAPIGYTLSILLNGLFFAKKMREKRYMTMLDPFQERYGNVVGGLMFLPALCGDLFWSAAILAALGSTISIILGLNLSASIIVSAAVAAGYTFFGGLFSVAYTDIAQLICIALGLSLSIPFAWHSEHVDMSRPANTTLWTDDWRGTLLTADIGTYIDGYLLLTFGGIPWQAYYQRALSAKSAKAAQYLSFLSTIGILALAVPPVIIGIIAKHTDWNATDISFEQLAANPSLTLPAVIAYLTPKAVSFFGLGAVAAAVMSSADSSILAASSIFSYNIYKNVIRPRASDREVIWVLRGSVIVCAAVACVVAIKVTTVYGLFVLCSDFVYVLLFPQFFLVLYTSFTNSYGVLFGSTLGLLLRILGGEPYFGFTDPVIKYPYYYLDPDNLVQRFPYKTLAMLANIISTVLVSLLMRAIFTKLHVPLKFDVLHCIDSESNPKRASVRPVVSEPPILEKPAAYSVPSYSTNPTYRRSGLHGTATEVQSAKMYVKESYF